jgi:RND superfamily putative drug exporter
VNLSTRLSSRVGAWLVLVVGLLLAVGILGTLRGSTPPAANRAAPSTSESARVDTQLAALPGHDVQNVLLVATRTDGQALSTADLGELGRLSATTTPISGHPVTEPVPSSDKRAAILQVPVRVSADNTENATTITAIRDGIRDTLGPGRGALQVQVTGGPAFGADVAKAFDGANITLLLTTVGIVALLLLLTYRSPILWLVPLAVVGLADQLAAAVTGAVGHAVDLSFDTGIISVLVFGAGTNYALLLISRYREELGRRPDHRDALAHAWRATMPAIVASNLTVVLALGSLVLASIPGTRGLGVAAAIGLLLALATVLTLLPTALAVCGRRLFWPFIPRPGSTSTRRPSIWGVTAAVVDRRPVPVIAATLALLGVLATGLVGTSVGLTQTDRFRSATESAAGLETLAAHFPAGLAQPLLVTTSTAHIPAVAAAIRTVPGATLAPARGTTRPAPPEQTEPAQPTGATDLNPDTTQTAGSDSGTAVLPVILEADPGSAEARELVEQVRAAVHAVPGADALVGGAQATDLDARTGQARDLRLVVPLVLAVSLVVLLVLLRSLVAPVLLLSVNALSAVATIGAGSWLGRHLFGWPALDLQVPLLAFLFLVALGIDYTIFLVHRARSEAATTGTRTGMVTAVTQTGAVITSAGIVLAAVFAALGVLPLVTLGQLGLIVGLGVLLDTFVVRTLLVPAVFAALGERIWWPRHPGAGGRAAAARPVTPPAHVAAAGHRPEQLGSAGHH